VRAVAGVAVIDGAGSMDKRVTIQSKTDATDTQGGRSTTWATLATVWAAITPLRAAEVLAATAIGSQSDYAIDLHYRADVTPQMRVTWRPYGASSARTFEIHGVQANPGMPQRLRLLCGEVV
jgi:SPP1 family predicted phage head-tail adaptor